MRLLNKRRKKDFGFNLYVSFQILIGPSDWENHLLNKDGAEKYRTQNLPNCSSCSGFYELGIVVSSPKSRLKVIPVYVGQADNVRTRLQQYGRGGAHLEIVQPNGELNGSVGHGLFTEVFSRDLSLAYRWVPVSITYSFPSALADEWVCFEIL